MSSAPTSDIRGNMVSPTQLVQNEKELFDYLYMEPRVAQWQLRVRRKNHALKSQVRERLGSCAEGILKSFIKPRAVLFRQLGTPTHETLRFLRMAKHLRLEPLILEYHGDKFVSAGNRYKRSLGKMPIYQFTGTDGVDSVQYKTVCDFPKQEGKSIGDVLTTNGKSLITIHHDLLRAVAHLNPKKHCFDATDWFHRINKTSNAESYYESVLSLFLRDGILFENYFTTSSERPFVQKTIIPAIERIMKMYGMKPLIVRLLPENEELRLFWDSFPKKTRRFLDVALQPKTSSHP